MPEQPPTATSQTSSPQTSPLAEAKATSLDELFSRDPLDLAKADIETIVHELRRQREAWAKAEAMGAKRAPKAAKALPGSVETSLEDLGL